MLTAALLALLMKCLYRRMEALITEIMVNGPEKIFYEKRGGLYQWDKQFSSVDKLEDIIQQIAGNSNRMVNESSPIVDTRLSDGSRVNIVLHPIALDGSMICIRKFPVSGWNLLWNRYRIWRNPEGTGRYQWW